MDIRKLLEKEAQTDDLIMLEFFANWCPHCQRMKPVVNEFEEETKGKVSLVIRIDIDEEGELADSYDIETIPTFILMRKGEQLWRESGEMTVEKLKEAVKRY